MDALLGFLGVLILANLGWTVALTRGLGRVEGKVDSLLSKNGIDPKNCLKKKRK